MTRGLVSQPRGPAFNPLPLPQRSEHAADGHSLPVQEYPRAEYARGDVEEYDAAEKNDRQAGE